MKFTIKPRKDRGTFEVRWFEGGKKRKSFPSRSAADDFVRDMKKLSSSGSSPMEVLAAQRTAAGTGYGMEALVRAGLEHLRAAGTTRADMKMTFRRASELVIERARAHGSRERTLENYRAAYAVLNQSLGDRVAGALLEKEVRDYLDSMPDRSGDEKKASATTKRHYLGLIRMAMRVAGMMEPLRALKIPSDDDEDVQFFTVEEVHSMLEAAKEAERGFLAVAIFAGIRPENLELLPPEAVSVADKRIRIPASIAKDRTTHLLDKEHLPPVLWRWLARYPYKPVSWQPLQRRLKRRVGRWIHDGVRHTAATYYCAIYGVAKTAKLLTHATESLVRRHYAGTVETTSAKKFYELAPERMKFVPPRIEWPADEELAAMLTENPATKVAKDIGCSDVALAKRCRARGISKPSRGHWTKLAFAT